MDTRIGWELTLAALLLSFCLSMGIAWVYILTYQGLSYVRSFANTLAISGVVSAMVMLAIGDDIARGIGLVGALTIVRFRATLKDTRDLMFAFAALGAGVACGVLAFSVAIFGSGVFAVAMIYISWSSFGSRRMYNAVLRLQAPTDPGIQKDISQVLRRHAPLYALINLRDLGSGSQEHAYHLHLKSPDKKGTLIEDLSGIHGVQGATLLLQDASIEP